MAAAEETGNLCPSLILHPATIQNGDLTDTLAALNYSWHHRSTSSFNSCRMSMFEDETPEVANLRRLIAEQHATSEERRRRIEATEQQIDEYERRIHNDRCAQDGDNYLQRAYHLSYHLSSYDDDNDDFVNRRLQVATGDTIAAYYRQASNEIRQRLVDVEAELVDIANNCGRIVSAESDDGKHHRKVDELNRNCEVDYNVQLVLAGSGHRQSALQLEALRLELARADDICHQQLAERRRLSSAIEEAQSQLKHEEERLEVAMFDRSLLSPNIRKPFGSLDIESNKFQTGEYCDRDLQITRRSDEDSQVPDTSHATLSASSSPAITRLNDSENSRNDKMRKTSKSYEIYAYGDIFAPDSASKDVRCGSLPDDDDLFADWHRLATLV